MITLLSVKVWSWSDSGEGFDDELLTRVSALLSAYGVLCHVSVDIMRAIVFVLEIYRTQYNIININWSTN